MEQSYKEKYEDILARLERAKNDDDVCDERFCCVINEIIPELAESEDEKVRKELIDAVQGLWDNDALPMPLSVKRKDEWLAWLENIPYTIDHKKREGFHLGYRACLEKQGTSYTKRDVDDAYVEGMAFAKHELEKQGEQNPAEWSEEDEQRLNSCLNILQPKTFVGNTETINTKWLKSLKNRVQPKQEWSEEDEEILRTILSDGIRGAELDMLQVNWLKSLRPQNRWKPSEDDIIILEKLIKGELEPKVFQATLQGILEQLKKLKEG